MTYLVGWRGLSIVVEPDFVKRAGQNSRLWMWTPRSRNAERRGLPLFASGFPLKALAFRRVNAR